MWNKKTAYITQQYYYTRLTTSFFRTTWISRYLEGKTSLDLNEAKGAGVRSCTMCKQSAPRSRKKTTPTHHHLIATGRMLFLASNQQRQSTHSHTHPFNGPFAGTTLCRPPTPPKINPSFGVGTLTWWRGSVVERWSLAGELSLSCARPAADG